MIDVVYDDIRLGRKKDLEVDFDKPGLFRRYRCLEGRSLTSFVLGMGQIYCIACAKYFKDEEVLAEHNRTKPHKRRLKALQRSPHRGEDLPVKND